VNVCLAITCDAAAAAAAKGRGGMRGQGIEEKTEQMMEAVKEDDGK